MKVYEFDKHLKKAGGHIGWNVGEITIEMKTIIRKPFMIKRYEYLNSNKYVYKKYDHKYKMNAIH